VAVYERGVPGGSQSGGESRMFRHAHDDRRLVVFVRRPGFHGDWGWWVPRSLVLLVLMLLSATYALLDYRSERPLAAAIVFEVVEERADQGGVQVGERQPGWWLAGLLVREAQQ
jgi:hypothetical protein